MSGLICAALLLLELGCSGGGGFIGGEKKKSNDDGDNGGQLADPPPTDVTGSYLECGKYHDKDDVVLVGCAVKSSKTKKKIDGKDCTFEMKLLKPTDGGRYEQYAMQTIKGDETSPFDAIGVTHTPGDDTGKIQVTMTCPGQSPRSFGAAINDIKGVDELAVDGNGDGSSAQDAPIDVDDTDRITPFTTQSLWDGGSAYFKLFAVVSPDDFCLPSGIPTSLLQTTGGQQKVQQAATVFLTVNPQIPQIARSFDKNSKVCFKTFGLIGKSNFITDVVAQAEDASKQWAAMDSTSRCMLVRVDDSILIIDRNKESITPAALLESVRRISYLNKCK